MRAADPGTPSVLAILRRLLAGLGVAELALVVGALHTTAIAAFMLLLTSFLGPVNSGAEARRALVVTVIVLVVCLAVTTYAAIALLWSRRTTMVLQSGHEQ